MRIIQRTDDSDLVSVNKCEVFNKLTDYFENDQPFALTELEIYLHVSLYLLITIQEKKTKCIMF